MFPSSRWKPLISTPSTRLPPSVSFVNAEPQPPRSLPPAAENLPNILRRAMLPDRDPTQSNPDIEGHELSSPLRPDDSPKSPLNVVDVSNQSASVPQGPTPVTLPSPTLDHVSVTPDVDQSPSPVNASTTSRSWFNVFYRSADQVASVAEGKVEVDSAPQALDAVPVTTELQEDGPRPVAVETTKPTESTAVVVNSSPRADRHVSPNGPVLRVTQSASNGVDAPSLSEGQPVSQSPPSPLPHHSSVSQARDTSVPVATNIPATGMFALNFTMLGKPRPRPEVAVTLPPRDPSATPSNESPVVTPDLGDSLNPGSVDTTEPGHMSPTIYVSPCRNPSHSKPTAVTEVGTNTWWTYLGWNAASSAAQDPRTQNGTQAQPTDILSAAPEQPPAADSTEGSQPHPSSPLPAPAQSEGSVKARMDLSSDVSATKQSPTNDNEPLSVQDADAGWTSQGHTWYAPWSWYQSPSPAARTVPPEMNSGSQQDPPRQSQTGPQTDEKQLAGDRETLSAAHQESPPQDPSAARPDNYSNPIQSVISANPTGWMSFFTAKAISMKSITHEEEDGKMEVMEIDDEMTPQPNSVSSSAPTATQPSPTPVTKPPVLAHPRAVDIPLPSSPFSKKSNDKRSPIPHAVIKSETVANDTLKRQPSPSPSKKSGVKTPTSPPPPNLVLPTWNDTFLTLPRSAVPHEPPSVLSKTLQYVSGVLFSRDGPPLDKGKGKAKEAVYSPHDKALPRTWDVLGRGDAVDVLRGCKRVVVVGVHGWFPGAVLRTFAGEPTGTSSKLVSGIVEALELFQEEHKVKLDKITKIPLEGEGTINRRVERLYQNLIGNKEWMDDLHDADAIFVATHSQGSVVSTHLLDRLITDRHIRTAFNADASVLASGVASGSISVRPPQRICCLALCGIHLGPLRYLSTSSLVQPYIQYFESTAARELFEFQSTESPLSRDYVRALQNVLNNAIKMVYIASLNDQVVGLYSGLFTSVSHPLILRALYIDGDAYHPSDFLSHLLVLLLRIRNAGLSDGGLLTHLSEVTAGSLNGIGHSTPYEERATYTLAVNYLFLTDSGSGAQVELVEEPFNALAERNDYEIPWALRDLVGDERVLGLFSDDIVALRDAFRNWHPKTGILRDVKKKLQPIQRLSSALMTSHVSRL